MKKYLPIFLIFIFAIILRFYQLGIIPSGFHVDEAYLTYNSYSILNTGKEITGNLFPLNLKSFLYSPAGYTYFSIPFIAILGLSEFSARFASAFFGSITIPLVFFLVLKLFKEYKYKNKLAILASFFLAISPWHINLSRVCTDNVIVVFFVSLGTYFFLHWLEKNKWYLLIISFLSFFITLYTYQAARSFVPIFLPLLFIYGFYVKKFNKLKIYSLILGYVLLIIIPVVLVLFSPTLSYRIKTLSVFQHQNTSLVLSEQQREDGVMGVKPLESRFFHNKITNYADAFTKTYFKHFSFEFLFTDAGLPDRYRVPGSGLLYLFELSLLILGLWYLFSFNKKMGWFILGWVLISPIGSGLTTDDVPNLQRTLTIFPAISILSGLGLIMLVVFLKKNIKREYIKKISFVIMGIIVFYSFLTYLHSYYIHGPSHRPWYRQEGYKELVQEINIHAKNYKKVVITDANFGPTIFLLFYNKYDPVLIQDIMKNSKSTKYGSMSFDNYEITDEKCPLREEKLINESTGKYENTLVGKKDILYVVEGTCKVPESKVSLISNIERPDGTSAFKLLSIK